MPFLLRQRSPQMTDYRAAQQGTGLQTLGQIRSTAHGIQKASGKIVTGSGGVGHRTAGQRIGKEHIPVGGINLS